jgi:A/G-specific adenine glycosylase
MPTSDLHQPILSWYDEHARDLPWRRNDASPWAILVSEVMLQQTPVSRVLPVYQAWLQRWPTPAGLADGTPGDAVRAWGRLGYPRRALRLHLAATQLVEMYDGEVPSSYEDLVGLPGVGSYTAAAVASFAFGQRHAVLDTNVRRVLARAVGSQEQPPPTLTRLERDVATQLVPDDHSVAQRWAVAVMELGALICTARAPSCTQCPIEGGCRWQHDGKPPYDGPRRRTQSFAGTDRQVRGLVLAQLRRAESPVGPREVADIWSGPEQLDRVLGSLLADGLIEHRNGAYALPGQGVSRAANAFSR